MVSREPFKLTGNAAVARIRQTGADKRRMTIEKIEPKMPYCITLRPRTDALITGWYDGSDSRWSTDRYRQKVFDSKRDARPVCDKLRTLCPRNAEVINIEVEQGDPSLDAVPAMFSPGIEC